ncbi:MAG TPA: TIGR03118 family protein [Terracidiphilus sp.]|nr:TIGR03118 family protein [Terracidiphilus sp.]
MTAIFNASLRRTLFLGFAAVFTSGVLARCANAQTGGYRQTNLASNVLHAAAHTQRSLNAPWGIAISPGTGFVIASHGSGTFANYDASGDLVSLPARVAGPPQLDANPGPSAVAANPTGTFVAPGSELPSPVLMATVDGIISGQYADHNGDILVSSLLAVDNSAEGAVYTGLAILTPNCCAPFLAAANFGENFIDTYTGLFEPLGIPGAFVDKHLPAGYAPFNIQVIGGQVFVAYALQNAARNAPVAGPGNGIIDIYELDGSFVRRFISHGHLNAPWGIAKAGAEFGAFSNDILVANFGDGTINAFNPISGAFVGRLKTASGSPIVNPGLRGIEFGGEGVGDPNTLYFTAGAAGNPGLFGAITETTR